MKKGTYYSIVSTGRKPNSNTLALIKKAGINADWLLTGEGEMLRNIDEDIGVYEKPQGRQSRISGSHGAASMRDYIRKSRQGEPVDSGEMLKLIYQIIRHLDEKYLQALKAFIESEIEHREQEDE